jgi:hypothetical protein
MIGCGQERPRASISIYCLLLLCVDDDQCDGCDDDKTEVFGEAIRQRATAIIVAHNHPSGNLEPSPEDRDVTRRLRQAGELLGIKVLDHLIFCEEGFLSMLEGGVF